MDPYFTPGKNDIIGNGDNPKTDIGTTEGVNDCIKQQMFLYPPAEIECHSSPDAMPMHSIYFTRNSNHKEVKDGELDYDFRSKRKHLFNNDNQFKRLNIDQNEHEYLESATPSELNFLLYKMSFTKNFSKNDASYENLLDIFDSWKLSGVCLDIPIKVVDLSNSDRRVETLIQGRHTIVNYYGEHVDPKTHRYLYFFLRYEKLPSAEHAKTFLVGNKRVTVKNDFTSNAKKEYTDAEFNGRIFPQIYGMSSKYKYPPVKEFKYEINNNFGKGLIYRVGELIGNKSKINKMNIESGKKIPIENNTLNANKPTLEVWINVLGQVNFPDAPPDAPLPSIPNSPINSLPLLSSSLI